MRVVRGGMSLSDTQWARTEPLLPDQTPRRGGRRRDHRQVIDAIVFKYRTGTPWMDLPEHRQFMLIARCGACRAASRKPSSPRSTGHARFPATCRPGP
ncbi:transposase [Streptomyces sp. NPDC056437]|uniref:transposase n=1 Tax=Streptomyces sp. NPDC056437 TaxID=3345816 RepID=UPI0036CFD2FF